MWNKTGLALPVQTLFQEGVNMFEGSGRSTLIWKIGDFNSNYHLIIKPDLKDELFKIKIHKS